MEEDMSNLIRQSEEAGIGKCCIQSLPRAVGDHLVPFAVHHEHRTLDQRELRGGVKLANRFLLEANTFRRSFHRAVHNIAANLLEVLPPLLTEKGRVVVLVEFEGVPQAPESLNVCGCVDKHVCEALGGGGVASLQIDRQGKSFAQKLLSLTVNVPKAWTEKHSYSYTLHRSISRARL